MVTSSVSIKRSNQAWRIIELVLLFLGVPLLYEWNLIPFHKSIPLALAFVYCLYILFRDKSFDKRYLKNIPKNAWGYMFLRVAIFFVVTSLLVFFLWPERLFILPKQNPRLMALIWIFYPLWSALPQELIFRPFFYHRYNFLFSDQKILLVINAFLFAFAHIIFHNWIALAGTFVYSFLFSYLYLSKRSLFFITAEHALYGNIIFTVGLGNFFYVPLG